MPMSSHHWHVAALSADAAATEGREGERRLEGGRNNLGLMSLKAAFRLVRSVYQWGATILLLSIRDVAPATPTALHRRQVPGGLCCCSCHHGRRWSPATRAGPFLVVAVDAHTHPPAVLHDPRQPAPHACDCIARRRRRGADGAGAHGGRSHRWATSHATQRR